MASKVVSLQSNSPRHLSSVFSDYQGEICDLLLAIKNGNNEEPRPEALFDRGPGQ